MGKIFKQRVARVKPIVGLSVMMTFLLLSGCAALYPPRVTGNNVGLSGYQYFYIIPTAEKTSVTGGAYGNGSYVYGSTSSHSVNPADLISGHFVKNGFIRLASINPEQVDKTLVINYSETGRRNTGWGSYTIEVTIQITDAKTNEVICTGVAEGRGSTEADDVRIAIDRCMNEILGITSSSTSSTRASTDGTMQLHEHLAR